MQLTSRKRKISTVATTDNPRSFDDAVNSLLVTNEPEVEETVDDTEEATDEDQTETVEDTEEEAEADEAEADEDNEDEENDAQPEQKPITVKVDGKEVAVTLDELKRSYSGQAYIQKGMQEAAAAKKEVEALYNALSSERQQVAQLYQQMQQGQIAQAPKAPDIAMADTDPIGYMVEKARYDQAMVEYQQQQSQFKAVQGQQTEAQKRAQQAYLQEQMRMLSEAIPEIADPKRSDAVKKGIVETGQSYGYSADEIAQIVDHRAVKVLHDAMKYRQLQEGKPVNKAAARPVIKPKAVTAPNKVDKARKEAKERLRKTGSIQDAVSLIMETPRGR